MLTNTRTGWEPVSIVLHWLSAVAVVGLFILGCFQVPASITGLPDQATLAGKIHWYGAIALMVLSGGHALAAIKHYWIDRNDTLVRMLDPRR